MDRDAVVQSESDCAAPAVKGFSNLKSGSNKDVLLDLTPEKPCKPLKGKELGRQKRQQEQSWCRKMPETKRSDLGSPRRISIICSAV